MKSHIMTIEKNYKKIQHKKDCSYNKYGLTKATEKVAAGK